MWMMWRERTDGCNVHLNPASITRSFSILKDHSVGKVEFDTSPVGSQEGLQSENKRLLYSGL